MPKAFAGKKKMKREYNNVYYQENKKYFKKYYKEYYNPPKSVSSNEMS
jgi:hypothetical protein